MTDRSAIVAAACISLAACVDLSPPPLVEPSSDAAAPAPDTADVPTARMEVGPAFDVPPDAPAMNQPDLRPEQPDLPRDLPPDLPPDAREPRPLGQPCAGGAECGTGFCVNGVCCETACNETCRACNLAGALGRCAPATGTVCDPQRCAGSTMTPARVCNAQGTCGPATGMSCAPYACAGTACGTTCADAGGCSGGAVCSNGRCADPLTIGLVGHWKLEEGQGITAADASGSGNTGTLAAGARWNMAAAPVPGGSTSAVELDGVDDSVSVPDAATLRPSSLTVATWVYFNTVGASLGCAGRPAFSNLQYLVFKRSPRLDNFEGYTLLLSQGVLYFALTSAAAVRTEIRAIAPAAAGVWYHVAGTFDGASARLYVDGTLQVTAPHPHPLAHHTRPLFLGRTGECAGPGEATWDGFLAGRLDDVRIYNRALGDAEVKALSGR